jgi:hypothetical protein
MLDFKNALEQGCETARQINRNWPDVKIIMMIRPQDENQLQDEPDLKCLYCISRDVSEEEFKAALEHIRQDSCLDAVNMDFGGFRPLNPEELPEGPQERQQKVVKAPVLPRNEEFVARELEMAGKIQEDILPKEAPSFPGWDISVRLEPAHETSGDFYDFIPLTDTKLGIVIADVTDKGMGAALFMALSSTLIRTFAARFPTLPAFALKLVSERILSDTRGSTFVTALYGILEPHTGRFIFANAGHPPGFLIGTQRGKEFVDPLRPTGMALGVSEQAYWKQKIARLRPGDILILYTDGITDAQNAEGKFFGEERMLEVVLACAGWSARQIQDALLDEVHRFVGEAPRQDDIALIVIRRVE